MAARPRLPLSRRTSTSTVGFPRESRISRAWTEAISAIRRYGPWSPFRSSTLNRASTSTSSLAGCGRSGTASTLATSRRSPCEMVSTSPALTEAEGFAVVPLIRTRPASHSVCAIVRRFTRRLRWRNLSRRTVVTRVGMANGGSRSEQSRTSQIATPHALSFRPLIRPRNLRLGLDLFQPLLEGRFLLVGEQHRTDLVTRLIECGRLGRAPFEDLDQVIPVLGLHDVGDLLG